MIAQVQEMNNQKIAVPISGSIPTGLPVGTWISFEKDQAPDNKWIKEGETFDENLYPALYLFLGTNKVPERFDHNRPSDIEEIAIADLGTSEETALVAPYDGFLTAQNQGGYCYLSVKSSDTAYDYIMVIQQGGYGNTAMGSVKKGDKIWKSNANGSPKIFVRWYKHPMFIKATSAIEITDQSTFLNTVQSLVQTSNSYSTEETATGGFWIDGKPIYRKCLTATNLTGGTEISVVSLGIDSLIKLYGTLVDSGNGNKVVIGNYYNMDYMYCGAFYKKSNDTIRFQKGNDISNTNVAVIVLEYTKS